MKKMMLVRNKSKVRDSFSDKASSLNYQQKLKLSGIKVQSGSIEIKNISNGYCEVVVNPKTK